MKRPEDYVLPRLLRTLHDAQESFFDAERERIAAEHQRAEDARLGRVRRKVRKQPGAFEARVRAKLASKKR